MEKRELEFKTEKMLELVNSTVKQCIVDAASQPGRISGDPVMLKYFGYGMQILNSIMDYTKALTDELVEQHNLIEKLESKINSISKKEKSEQ